jgi:hypothetical protein
MRTAIGILLVICTVTVSRAEQAASGPPDPASQVARVLFITAKDCPRCEEELTRLRRPGGDFETMQSQGWKIGTTADSHLQIVDKDAVAEVVKQLGAKDFPTVVGLRGKEILRSFRDGCTTPLDSWTFGWLAKGINERPQAEIPEPIRVASTGSYPLRGNHWSIDGDPSPSHAVLLGHLRGPVHGPQIKPEFKIESWSYEELRSLHDNLHEIEMGGAYARYYDNRPPASGSFGHLTSGSRKTLGH